MSENTGKSLTFSQGSAISVGLAILLGSYAVWGAVQITTLETKLSEQRVRLEEINRTYVPKTELMLQLQNIDIRLRNIEEAVGAKRK